MRAPAVALTLAVAAMLAAAPASAQSPSAPSPSAPSAAVSPAPAVPAPPFVEPNYNPTAHGGLPHGAYLLMSRGVRRRSTGMMVAGIVFTSLGAVAMATGTGIYFGRGGCSDGPRAQPTLERGFEDDFGGEPCSTGAARAAGMAILLAGTITTAMGVPLWILGASDVPWAEGAGQNQRAPGQSVAGAGAGAGFVPSLTPVITKDRSGVAFGWRF